MAVKPRNTTPAIKDRVLNFQMILNVVPTGRAAVLFLNPFYDYQVVSMGAYVAIVTGTTPAPFKLGQGAYVDSHGVAQVAIPEKFLAATACVDSTGAPFGTTVMQPGTFVFFTVQPDPTGQGLNILPAGAPLVLSGAGGANTGEINIVVALRPKEKDRNDASKRPGASADQAFSTYFK